MRKVTQVDDCKVKRRSLASCPMRCVVGQSVVIMVMEEEQICCEMTPVFPSAICSDFSPLCIAPLCLSICYLPRLLSI